MTTALERDVERVVERMAPIGGMATLALGARAAAHTRPAFYDPADLLVNVDNAFLASATVAGEPAIVVAIAHGNVKDNACAFASAAAMVAANAELAVDFLGEADVGPALQRALHAADARIREVVELPPDPRFLSTCVGVRKTLRGIGASMLAAVVTPAHVFIAHAGECQALLVTGSSRPTALTRAHTLAMTPEGRAAIAEDPSRRADFADIIIRLVGFDNVQVELTRAPFPRGTRLVIGNPALRYASDFTGAPHEAVLRIATELTAHREASYWPSTLAIIDALPLL